MNEMATMNNNIGANDAISFWINLFTVHSLIFFLFFFFPVLMFLMLTSMVPTKYCEEGRQQAGREGMW